MTLPTHPPTQPGRLFGVGLGPGDPELVTLKALRIIREAHVIAFPTAKHGRSIARSIVASELTHGQIELPMVYPLTTEAPSDPGGYDAAIEDFYDRTAEEISVHLQQGRDVAVLCEGDPFFYGSYMYLHDRLAHRFLTEVVPGISSVTAASSRLGIALVRRDSVMTVLPATLSEDQLEQKLRQPGAFVIIKIGRNFAKVKNALRRARIEDRAYYIERATMAAERVLRVQDVDPESVPYFSLIVIPNAVPNAISDPAANETAHTTNASNQPEIVVLGLGPGDPDWITPEVQQALHEATDLVGYQPYLDRVPHHPGQRHHGSDNKVEAERARDALALAASGRRVCVVSSGDPGIFAMATAVVQAIEEGPEAWRSIQLRVLPGVSAMQAAAARAGAPLGHDFCVLSLSNRLKPWEIITQRIRAAMSADLGLALYNPVSSERRWQLGEAREIMLQYRLPQTPVVLGYNLGKPNERVVITDLGSLDPATVDMQTILLIGSSTTKMFALADGRKLVYTPRTYGTADLKTDALTSAATKEGTKEIGMEIATGAATP
ncbi:precorrin-2 C(20)-methyltransferase [Granulicella sp. L60]|uniref:precorrin-2 C(20)-methyltransferase n=1 Tax=Granulicella sp. L60 TaxID=1641866 RepID=UPI00131BEF68|nr:precorrin-2 C(20)-methyltransferase [Granulicella sp. L60]